MSSAVVLPTWPGTAPTRPFGEAYITASGVETIDPAERQGSNVLILTSETLAGRTPDAAQGLPVVAMMSVWPMTPQPTMGKSTETWYSAGQACGR